MKVGDYVRTKDYQNIRSRIGKIIKQDGKYYYLDIDEDTQMVWEEDTVLKSRPKIIDLIEVGDYVNGLPVLHKENNELVCGLLLRYKEENIENIVTKEQFESIKYRIGD